MQQPARFTVCAQLPDTNYKRTCKRLNDTSSGAVSFATLACCLDFKNLAGPSQPARAQSLWPVHSNHSAEKQGMYRPNLVRSIPSPKPGVHKCVVVLSLQY